MPSNDWGGDGMTPTGHAPIAPESRVREVVYGLQREIGEGNKRRGFHEEGDALRYEVHHGKFAGSKSAQAPLRNYYMMKISLIMSEGAEALEDLRSGRSVNLNHYTIDGEQLGNQHRSKAPEPNAAGHYVSRVSDSVWSASTRTPKPEGVPSEIADIVIRCFDFADEAGFSLIDAILEKLEYNETRARMHGRQV